MGIYPWGITTVTGTGIFLVLSPCGLLPVSPPLLSLLVGSDPSFFSWTSSLSSLDGRKGDILGRGLRLSTWVILCFMQAETLIHVELAM